MDQNRITNALNNEIIWKHKKNNRQNKIGEKVPSPEVVDVVLVHFNLVDN